ncbi:MAG: fused MFS/spermidine synthase [Anaerolineales bacterium]|nr:fused MFS/spermidine synthase [Anaerolineales bacterium]
MRRTNTIHKIDLREKAPIILVSVLFFLSGAAGLMYQTVWVRLLELYFGVTLTAITLIVSAYMAGLGLGSMIGGRIAGKSRNPILLYGIIEAVIGVFGILSPALINWLGQNTAGSPYALVFFLSFALLLIPTLLMGMTLPLLTQAFVKRMENSGQVIGLLYGINTLGAAIGALASGYILIGWFGFGGTLLTAAIINFIVGAGAVPLKPGMEVNAEQPSHRDDAANPSTSQSLSFQAVLGFAFLVGFIGMSFEMVWFRILGIFTKGTAYSFPGILFVFLTALALGGWFWGKKADQSKDASQLFWKLQLSIGIVTSLSFFIFWFVINTSQLQPQLQDMFYEVRQPIPPTFHIGDELVLSRSALLTGLLNYFLPILIMVLPAGLLMGGGLPILDKLAIDQISRSGRRVGDIHLANITGSVLGTLVTSFVLLPLLGSELTYKTLAALTLIYPAIALLSTKTRFDKSMWMPALALIVLIVLLPGKGQFYTKLYQTMTGFKSVAIHEAGDSVLAITFRGEKTDPAELWIGGIKNSFFPSTGGYERSALTCASAVQPKRILVIGIGGANTANFLASLPGVEEVIVVELIEHLGTFLNDHVPVARSTFSQPNVRYITDDGRRYLYANPHETYDLIFIDPLWSFTAGHNNLYSLEAMELYKKHLSNGGIFCAWINEGHLIPKTAASLYLHSDNFGDYLVNSDQPLQYDLTYMSKAYEHYLEAGSAYIVPSVSETLNPDGIMERLKSGQSATLELEADTPTLTDLTPWLEYYYLCPPSLANRLSIRQMQYCHQSP